MGIIMQRRDFLKSLAALPFAGAIPLQQTGPVERFAVISDTHQFPYPVSLSLMAALKQRPVDFVIVAGDVSEMMCGPDWIFDCVGGSTDTGWQWTRQQLDSLGKPWLAVPGNHDLISSGVSYFEPVSSEALDLWGQYVGPLRFVKETEYCRIVGVNYLEWDYGWMSQELATEKRKIVVSHIPLFGVNPVELRDQDAGAKIDFLLTCGVELFICGHSHQFSVARVGGLTQVVCPPVSYTLTPDFPQLVEGGLFPVGIPALGWLEVEATAAGLTVELWRWDGVRLLDGWGGCMWLPWVGK
jgi:3',5'-cyclic AMP phosphodiesterase CpdA